MPSDTRERVLATARDLVHAASYADVGVDDVCRAAGVRKGSLYHFFPSKAELGLAVLERDWELMSGVLDDALDREEPPLERLDRFVASFVTLMGHMSRRLGAVPGCPIGNLATELPAAGGPLGERVADVLGRYVTRVADTVRDAQARGDVARDLDPVGLARDVVAVVQGSAALARAHDDLTLLDGLAATVRRLLPPG
ncbi:TetR/AcrR family transcriptional regulator [Cellulomonas carbonis]|uniref:TetR family transcriptional regulator n=1 Tax=Cellulomonas carbonis T26 TaxID=947969 RepID=A0A0A0BQD7_9CELL|nr:TetR/AcrR family transcriptional regulator [Cellulomonas carbonis]KGM10181.1 TetR family transcriptional regulator [Cellulomonas carbonis T26]